MHLSGRAFFLIVMLTALLAPPPAEAAWYLAGWSRPQNNDWAKNESSTPPVSFSDYVPTFYGGEFVSAYSDPAPNPQPEILRVSTGLYKGANTRRRGYASFRLDDLVFSCADNRSQVTYRTRLVISAQHTWDNNPGGRVWYFVGDPDCPWGSCSGGHWGDPNLYSWSSNAGGTGPLAGFPAGTGFGPALVTGPNRTAMTGVPVVFSVSIGTEAFSPSSGAVGNTIALGTASFPMVGPVFELPDGCTCNSIEGHISDNQWVEPTPVRSTTWGAIKTQYK